MIEGSLNILLIDDDEVDRMLVRRALRKSDFESRLLIAEDGQTGLSLLDREQVDVIILDYRLPDFTGLELLEKIRSREILAPVIVVTSHGDETIAAEAFKSGASDYLSKDMLTGAVLDKSIRSLIKIKIGEEQRQAAERALKVARERVQLIVENSAISLFSLDRDGVVTLSEGKDAERLGLSPGTIVGQSIFEVAPLKEAGLSPVIKTALEGESTTFAGKLENRWYEFKLSPLTDEQNQVVGVTGVASDITDRIQAEEELRKAKFLAEKNAKVKEEFLANMSHEIRTPMNAIIGFTNLLTRTPLTEEQTEFVTSIETAGENLLVIINDILDFSKIEAGKLSIEEQAFSLPDLLNETFRLFKPKAAEKDLDFRLKVADSIQGDWIGDSVRLNQILVNLLGNAIKFTETGWVELSVQPKLIGGESVLDFRVSDTGIGLEPDKVSRIFESFTQGAKDTTMKFGGTGLGLAIVKNLVELMGGRVGAESELGKGSVFSFQLPLKPTGNTTFTAEVHRKEQGPDLSELEDLLILMAEDNKMNQILAKRILEDAGVQLVIAENGRHALDWVKKRDFDLILMDVQMPQMDGLDATRAIRALDPPANEIPIVALTAHAVASEINKCFEAGMNDYVVKPYKPNDLLSKILQVIAEEEEEGTAIRPTTVAETPTWEYDLFDPDLLREVSGGSEAFLVDLTATFLEENLPGLGEIEEARKAENPVEMAAVLHRIKPGFEIMGVKGSKALIRDLENLLKGEVVDWGTVDDKYATFKAIAKASGVEIQQFFEGLKRPSSV